MSLWAIICIEVVVVVAAILSWNYFRSGRYKTARQELQILLAETLRDTNQGEFLFVISRNVKTVEVRLPVCDEDLQRFKELVSERLKATPHEVELKVAALEDDLPQIESNVVVWGPAGGDVHVARRPHAIWHNPALNPTCAASRAGRVSFTLGMRPMDIRTLIVHLESPLSAYASAEVSPRDIVLAGLNWSQSIRHRAFAIARRFEKGVSSNA